MHILIWHIICLQYVLPPAIVNSNGSNTTALETCVILCGTYVVIFINQIMRYLMTQLLHLLLCR